MDSKIYIVEGLPGVGKSYFCELLQQELQELAGRKKILFFEERDEDHPFHHSRTEYRDSVESVWNGGNYGVKLNLKGLDGALEILAYFKELKEKFIGTLNLSPIVINNTVKKPDVIKDRIREILQVGFHDCT